MDKSCGGFRWGEICIGHLAIGGYSYDSLVLPPPIISRSNMVHLVFKGQHYNEGYGWRIGWSAVTLGEIMN